MGSVNKVILVGNLGADPELKWVGERALCNLRVATTSAWKDKNGQKRENTEWHRVTVWGDQAENCAKYLAKGRSVYVDGRLQTRSYDKDGQKHYATDVVATQVVFLGGGQGGGAARGGGGGGSRAPRDSDENYNQDHERPASTGSGRARNTGVEEPPSGGPPSDDDIPFIRWQD